MKLARILTEGLTIQTEFRKDRQISKRLHLITRTVSESKICGHWWFQKRQDIIPNRKMPMPAGKRNGERTGQGTKTLASWAKATWREANIHVGKEQWKGRAEQMDQ